MTDFVREAVVGRLSKQTNRSAAEVDKLLEHVYPESFLTQDGELDEERLSSFAAAVGPRESVPFDPVRAHLERTRTPGKGSTGSVAAMKDNAIAQMLGEL